jgi:hypothetical protein
MLYEKQDLKKHAKTYVGNDQEVPFEKSSEQEEQPKTKNSKKHEGKNQKVTFAKTIAETN